MSLDTQVDGLYVGLDLPLPRDEARTRELPESTCRLLLGPHDRTHATLDGIAPKLAHWITRWQPAGTGVYLIPSLLFSARSTVDSLVRRGDVRHLRASDEELMACGCEDAVAAAMHVLRCEELGILYAANDAVAIDTARAVAENRAHCASHNAPFWGRLHQHGGFLFFSDTHLSLEVLGSLSFVYSRCFRAVGERLLAAAGVPPSTEKDGSWGGTASRE
jgi:hypothetical protein